MRRPGGARKPRVSRWQGESDARIFIVGGSARAWRDALVAVVAGFVVMAVVAAAGLWCAGAGDLPDGAFPHVVAAVVVMAAGGSLEVSGVPVHWRGPR